MPTNLLPLRPMDSTNEPVTSGAEVAVPTGEQPAISPEKTTLSHDSKLTVALAIGLLIIVAGGAAAYTRTQSDMEHIKTELTDLRAQYRAQSDRSNEHELRLQRNELTNTAILQTLGELKAAMRDLSESKRR